MTKLKALFTIIIYSLLLSIVITFAVLGIYAVLPAVKKELLFLVVCIISVLFSLLSFFIVYNSIAENNKEDKK